MINNNEKCDTEGGIELEFIIIFVVGLICLIIGFFFSRFVYYKKGYKEGLEVGQNQRWDSICDTPYEKDR